MRPLVAIGLVVFCAIGCSRDPSGERIDSISISVPYELDILDPHAKTRLSNYAAAANFYEPLVGTDAANKILPRLARSWENPDAYTWIFHLQPNVQFHNGKAMDSSDVLYSFERVRSDPNLEVASYLNDVKEVRALSSTTVRVRTKTPLAIFLNKLNNVLVVPRGSTTSSLSGEVNGTGPYKLKEWVPRQKMQLVRNENYWGDKPPLKNVTYFLKRSPELAVNDLISGKSQFIQYDSKKLEAVIRSVGSKYEVLRQDNYFLKYLSYDVSRDSTPYCASKTNPFKNPLVREAIHRGINRRHLVEELATYAVPAYQPVPAFVFGFNPAIQPPSHNLQAAKQLLADAGFPNGFKVTLFVRNILQETGHLIQKQLAALAIDVELKTFSDPEFFSMLDTQDFTFFLSRVGATVGDASDILEPQLHSRGSHEGYGVRNYIGYRNAEVDESIDRSAKVLKIDDRREALEHIMAILMKDLPWIPLYIDQDVYAIDRRFVWQPRHDSHVFAYEISLR